MTKLHILHDAKEIARRVAELGRQISGDFRGQTLDVIAVLDNAYVFVADLVRAMDIPVRTHFIRTEMQDIEDPNTGKPRKEIFYTPEINAHDRNVLLVEGVLQSGITTDFLLRRIGLHVPRIVKIAVCVDKPTERKVFLEPDYAAFQLASNEMVVGYGLAWNGMHGNLGYLASPTARVEKKAAAAARKVSKGKKKR